MFDPMVRTVALLDWSQLHPHWLASICAHLYLYRYVAVLGPDRPDLSALDV